MTQILNIDDLKEEYLNCDVCGDEYDEDNRDPRVLPCLHTFCGRCLEGMVRDWTLTCPTCRIKHNVPGDSVKNFPKEHTRRSLRDFIRLKRKTHNIPCRDCPDSSNAVYFCKDCQTFMCAECTHAHLRNFLSRNHQIANFEQLRKYGLETFQRELTCSVPGHEGQPLSHFCTAKVCSKPLCKMCTVLDHDESKGHVIKKIQDVYEEERQIVNELTKKLEDKISVARNVMKEAEDEHSTLAQKEDIMKHEIDIEMDAGIKMLEIRRRELKDNLTGRIKEKKSVLQKQRDYLRYYVSLMASAREFSSHSLVHSMPAEFVQLTKTISNRLDELKDQHLDVCPLENSYVTFDRNAMGQEFKSFVLGMGQIRSTAIYPPKTSVETLEAPLGQETEVIKVFLYDAKGRPQRDSFDAISVEIKDPKGNVVPSRVVDAKTVDGCYKIVCKPGTHGTHKARIRVLNRPVNEEGFQFVVRAPGEIDKRFGDILCVGFLFDAETAHHERAISMDGRNMRSDIETLRRVAGLRLRQNRGIARGRRRFPWELESAKQMKMKERDMDDEAQTSMIKKSVKMDSRFTKNKTQDIDELDKERRERMDSEMEAGYVNTAEDDSRKALSRPALLPEKSIWNKKLKKYSGVIATKFLRAPGKFYWEVQVFYRIHVTLLRNALLFEIGISRLDAVHSSFYVGSQTFAWSFSAERCGEHKQVCHKFRHKRQLLNHHPITSDTAGSTHHATYGFLLDTTKREWTVIDVNLRKTLFNFQSIDTTEPLWPVFGTYNPYSVHVELTLKTGRDIVSIPDILRPGSANSKTQPKTSRKKKLPFDVTK
ncbi:E3 ubiquitin-protein ligase TRIM45-like [Ruditapes philippinarum]|uniref:E3 ubiquitin-protein ligase TRIM45-like n=1 Tax=Ruditapes philippinarum TaxID=129788 RepID=UPI00295BF72B|nr:E3 ubiquitin-protein ligase TRIM45-like [Ruditapes philippinarum]XP_060575164.1 E3 ubiquitin-protein ligase TRIM45-like [Ruditapes philippinarum]